jgi:histidinol phosphatase-like enzyme
LKEELAEADAFLDAEYYCMHHPQAMIEQFKVTCDCRKPKPGLLLRAGREHDIDMSQSWFVGDNVSDVEAGKGAGCRTLLIGKMKSDTNISLDDSVIEPNRISAGLREAIDLISETKNAI